MRISDWSSDVCSSDFAVRALRSVGTGRPAVAAVGGVRRAPARAPRRLRDRRPPGRRAQRLVVAALALRRDRQAAGAGSARSEEHTSELQSLMRISYAVFCLKKKTTHKHKNNTTYCCTHDK